MFEVGDCVVCVDDRARDGIIHPIHAIHARLLRKGETYRVSNIDPRGGVGVKGIKWPFHVSSAGTVWGYNPTRFRKIDEEVTPAFREMLRDLPKVRTDA